MLLADSSLEENNHCKTESDTKEVGYHVVDVESAIGKQRLYALRQYPNTHGC